MHQPLITLGRVVVVLAFLIGMPLLAIPGVVEWLRSGPASPHTSIVAGHLTHKGPVLSEPPVLTPQDTTQEIASAIFLQSVKASESASLPSSRAELERIAAEIQALGATFYRLDRISDAPGAEYRFTAQFLRGGTPPRRMTFEATSADPQQAMRQVLAAATAR